MTRGKISAFALGIAVAITAAVFAQSGGYPSRPRFLSAGVGISAPVTNGRVRIDGATPEYRISRATGTVSDWSIVAPAGSTDLRFNSSGDLFTFTTGGNLTLTQLNSIAPSDFARLSQTNVFTGATAGGRAHSFVNSNNGTTSYSQLGITNAADGLFLSQTAASFSSAFLTNGPTTNHSAIYNGSNIPFVLGTNTTKRIQIAGDGSLIELDATAIDSNGVDMTPQSGNFTASFDDACTTTPTITFGYQRIGNVVFWKIESISGFSCTGDSVTFSTTGAPVPAALRPTTQSQQMGPISGACVNNSANTLCDINVSTAGNVSFTVCTAAGCGQLWTAALNRAVPGAGITMSYMLGTP